VSADALLGADPAAMVASELQEHLLDLGRLRCGEDARLLATVGRWDGEQLWALDGSTSGAAWLAPRLGLTLPAARELVKAARWCRGAPLVLAALGEGRLTYAKVLCFARLVTEGCAEAFVRDEEMLVRHASGLRVEDVTRFLRHWATLVDPDGADDSEQGRQHMRTVYLARTFGGSGDLRGNLNPETLALAEALFEQVMDELYEDEKRGDVPERTAAQRRHDAFHEILRRAAAFNPQNGKQAHPSLLLLLEFDTMAEAEAAEQAEAEAAEQAEAEAAQAADADHTDLDDEQAEQAEPEVAEVVAVPSVEDLARQCGEHLDHHPHGEDGDEDADAATGSGVVPRPPDPNGDGDRGSRSGAKEPVDESTDSGRPDSGKPGRGRGDPVRVDPTLPPRFLRKGSAKATPWDGPMITAQAALRLACDAGLSRIIVGPDGEVLDHGREKRLFTPPQRRAILKRYGFQCGWPDCDRPAGWLRIHHIDWWTRDHGPTDQDNGIPLCPCHHTCVHEGGFTLGRAPTTGQITFWRPDGTQLLPTNPNQALWAPGEDR
jgi:hypothetical protein